MKAAVFKAGLALGALVLGLGAGVGCGGSSNLDVCYAQCSYSRRCLGASDELYTNCRNDCDKAGGAKGDQDRADAKLCTNASDLRAGQISCYNNQPCGEIAEGLGCLAQSAVSQLNSRCVRP